MSVVRWAAFVVGVACLIGLGLMANGLLTIGLAILFAVMVLVVSWPSKRRPWVSDIGEDNPDARTSLDRRERGVSPYFARRPTR